MRTNVDLETAPAIYWLLYNDRSARERGRRIVILDGSSSCDLETIEEVARELASPDVVARLDAGDVATIALAAASARNRLGDDGGAAVALQRLRIARDGELDVDIALAAIVGHSWNKGILEVFPDLAGSPVMIDAILDAAAENAISGLQYNIDVNALVIREIEQARRALLTADASTDDLLPTYLTAAMARGLGWTRWAKLFAVLCNERELAGDKHTPGLEPRKWDTDDSLAMRRDARAAILTDPPVRRVAKLILDLDGALSNASPDVRAVFVERLRKAIGDDSDLRKATIEALLWRSTAQRNGLALFAVTRLVEPDDEGLIVELTDHPDREVGYAADTVWQAVFGGVTENSAWPAPGVSTIAEGLFTIGLSPPPAEQPMTWLGDRLLERMIEQTIAGEERKFAQEYADHSEEGEEGLLRSFLSDLAHRFDTLDQGLGATARATSSDRITSIALDYRPVDKAEEGKPGVNPRGDTNPPAFSADLCLIVDPYLDGYSLGKRATLVQAKRLRRKEPTRPELGFASSFKLDPQQTADLVRQTASSFFLFQCSGLLDRGIPVMPAQLVDDLARHHAPTAGQIPSDLVGPASRSLAEWLTYMVLALRTGDPLAELVAKAEGGEGRRPRPLARFGTAEITVRVGEPKPIER